MADDNGIRCMLMRGGSSKGAYFLAEDLPTDEGDRNTLLMRLMGTPDPRQIDGIGGAHPLTSKVAIVSPTEDDGHDLDYLFLQLGVDEPVVSERQNCGNLLAGVAPFALERGLLPSVGEEAEGSVQVRILMRNTNSVATATMVVADGRAVYHGDTPIGSVPGTAAPIRLDFEGIAGGSCGSLLPTGNTSDEIDGVACTLIDNGMPVVVMRADALGISGDETCAELEANDELRIRLERIRIESGKLMNLGDVTDTTVPKMTMVAPPNRGGALNTRTFIPHRCHDAIGVLGAVSVATAALLPNTPAGEVIVGGTGGSVVLEHPTGTFEAAVSFSGEGDGLTIERAGIIRTARKLMDGFVFPREYD